MKRNVWILTKALKEGKNQMKEQDYDGAREAILRAHDLYPQNEEINSILASCDSLQGKEPSFRVEPKRNPSQDYYSFEDDRNQDHLKQPGQILAYYSESASSHSFRYARVSFHSKASLFVQWLKPVPITSVEKNWCDAGLPVACGPFELNPEMKEDIRWKSVSFYKCNSSQGMTKERFEVYPRKGEVWAVYKEYDLDAAKGHGLVLVEIVSEFEKYRGVDAAMLVKVEPFRCVYRRKGGKAETLHVSPSDFYRFSHFIPSYRFKGGEIDGIAPGMIELDQLALPEAPSKPNTSPGVVELGLLASPNEPAREFGNGSEHNASDNTKLSEIEHPIPMPKEEFGRGQIWSVYFGKDRMPRAYVRLDARLSDNTIGVSLLEPMPNHDVEIRWKNQNLPISCGVFKVSETRKALQLSSFCCKIPFQPSKTGEFYRSFPLEGEIWAMYKNWNAKWKQEDFENHECQIVQVVSTFSEAEGVKIARLERVKGCVAFFQKLKYEGFDLVQTVGRNELLSFSHRIPAIRVPGIGKHGGVPENSWHLEMDALLLKPGIGF